MPDKNNKEYIVIDECNDVASGPSGYSDTVEFLKDADESLDFYTVYEVTELTTKQIITLEYPK
jgi:hypothetical protein